MNYNKNAGFVIIVVTVILVALSLLGMLLVNLTSIDFSATDNYVNNLQAEKAAGAGLEYAMYVLKMDKYGTDSVVYNSNSYRYGSSTTLGYDENYDAYTEEWWGTGTGKIFCNATAAANDVDNNGDGVKDSRWLDAPFALDRGLKAQYAILIEDAGESRVNVNVAGNLVGAAGTFVYGTGATASDVRLQDILGTATAKNVLVDTAKGRYGANGVPGNAGTSASQFQPRNPAGDDRPYGVLDAADLCFGTCASSAVYQSRLRSVINNETLFQSVRGSLTMYSADSLIASQGISNLLLPDNKNYYRLKLDNTTSVGSITAQLQVAGFSAGTATQLAVNVKDYMDADTDITVYGTPTKFGLEPHPFVNELYHNGTYSAYPCQHRVELYNPFNTAVTNNTLSVNGSPMDLVLKVAKQQYYTTGSPACAWLAGTLTTSTYPITMSNFSVPANGYVVFGYDAPGAIGTLAALGGTQTITGFNIYDYDSDNVPMSVTVTLMGSSSALGSGNYLILDEAQPEASYNTIRGDNVLWLLYQLIAYIRDKSSAPGSGESTSEFESLLNDSGDGNWDEILGNVVVEHSATPSTSSNNALNKLTYEIDHLTGNVYIVAWGPGAGGISDAIGNLQSLITHTSGNSQINADTETIIINQTNVIINLLEKALCSASLSVRASTGERKNPMFERSNNWGTSSSAHSLGVVNTRYGSVTTNRRKQLVVANNNIVSLGEMGHLLTIGYGTQASYTQNDLYRLLGTETTVVDNAKLNLSTGTATAILDYFTIVDPKNDAVDDDADGAISAQNGTDTGSQAGDIDGPEIQAQGRININTAPASVLAALPGTSATTSMGSWSAMVQSNTGYSLISNIINARPFLTCGAVAGVTGTNNSGMNYFGTDNVDNDGDGLVDEKDETDLIFTAISNLITTHTNVFAVYVTSRIVNSDASETFAEKKLVAIVDRSVSPTRIRYFRWMTEW